MRHANILVISEQGIEAGQAASELPKDTPHMLGTISCGGCLFEQDEPAKAPEVTTIVQCPVNNCYAQRVDFATGGHSRNGVCIQPVYT